MENGITWGYARISSMTQHEDRQIKKLKEFGVEERNIIVDKESGKNLERDGYQLLNGSVNERLKGGGTSECLYFARNY